MSAEIKDMAASGAKKVWCTTWTFAVNSGRRLKILGRYALACQQQANIKKATRNGREKRPFRPWPGEKQSPDGPEVNAAVQKAKELKELKEKNYQVIAPSGNRIGSSCVIATRMSPGASKKTRRCLEGSGQ